MKAAVIHTLGRPPAFAEFPEPESREGAVLIDVETAGLGGWDVLGAYRLPVEYPCIVRGEGVGRAEDGRRVYFGERSIPPFGAWAERTIVPAEEVWDVPDDVDDVLAITMAIAGTGALIPLEAASIKGGDAVLVLGATGVLGQIGLQIARIMGAGCVVAAARSRPALERLLHRRIADAVVTLTAGPEDAEALKAASGAGFDVVLDIVCGAPLLAALKATRWGARIVTVGVGAGAQVNISAGDLLFRTWSVVGTGQRSAPERRAIWYQLLDLARKHRITVDHAPYELSDVAKAWAAQMNSPHAKITASIRA
jgi:NADPH:quinone reductase-like Zn-dependent oxidoreductase